MKHSAKRKFGKLQQTKSREGTAIIEVSTEGFLEPTLTEQLLQTPPGIHLKSRGKGIPLLRPPEEDFSWMMECKRHQTGDDRYG